MTGGGTQQLSTEKATKTQHFLTLKAAWVGSFLSVMEPEQTPGELDQITNEAGWGETHSWQRLEAQTRDIKKATWFWKPFYPPGPVTPLQRTFVRKSHQNKQLSLETLSVPLSGEDPIRTTAWSGKPPQA